MLSLRIRACSTAAATISLALFGGANPIHAGPCTEQIAQLQSQIGTAAATPRSGPTAHQSVDAQLHHQPTPGAVKQAVKAANTDADAALNRAKNADAAGDSSRCTQALHEVSSLYGID